MIVAHRNPPGETVKLVEAVGAEYLVHHADVSKGEDIAALAAAVEAAFGGVDVLVNNAGVYPMQPFLEMEYSQWREMFDVNTDSIFHLCRAFVPGLQRGQSGDRRLHPLAGDRGRAARDHRQHPGAGSGPHPDHRLRPADRRHVRGLPRRQCIKRTEEPKDLAGAVSWLASDDAAFVTGQTVVVDGGWHFN